MTPEVTPAADFSRDPAALIDAYLKRNERGEVWSLSAYQRRVLSLAFRFDAAGRLLLRLLLWSEPKKSGKTYIAACLAVWWAFVTKNSEIICYANDFEQAQSRVFRTITAVLEHNGFTRAKAPWGKPLATVMASEVRCASGTIIKAVASDYKGAAGSRATLSIFDELWGFSRETSERLFEEATPIPTALSAWILVVTTAGFTGESALLERLYSRGLAGERLDSELEVYRDGEMTMFWSRTPRQPWQTAAYYDEQRRILRPNTFRRLHGNEWVSAESSFITAEMWDANVEPDLSPLFA